ncbi:DnaB-like helicase N-terminal domain-containing protein [Streptomyces sp. NPDC003442]
MTDVDDGLSRIPPHDVEAEQAVLGGMLLSEQAIKAVIEIIEGPDFYRPAHETIFRVITAMTVQGTPIDPITVAAELTERGEIARVGGASYLHTLVDQTPTAANAEYYAEIVRKAATRRKVLEAVESAAHLARSGDGDLDAILDALREQITTAAEASSLRQRSDTGWEFSDLSSVLNGSHKPVTPVVGARDDGHGLFYPGHVNGVQGESEAGKSWVALITALIEINRGNHVVYIDFEDSEAGVVGRLLLIGALPRDLQERFHYVRPHITPAPGDLRAFVCRAAEVQPTLVVVDGVTEAMSMLGLELKDNTEIAKFRRMLLRPLADTGAAVVSLDHVVKNSESRGRYALGGVHKLNGVDGVQYMLEAVHPFGINAEGRSRLRVAKDRPAQVRKHALPSGKNPLHWFADVVVKSEGETFADAHIYPPIERTDDTAEIAAEREKDAKSEVEFVRRKGKILAVLEKAGSPLTTNGITSRVPGRTPVTRAALGRLVDSGEVVAEPGPKRAMMHSLPDKRQAKA